MKIKLMTIAWIASSPFYLILIKNATVVLGISDGWAGLLASINTVLMSGAVLWTIGAIEE